jgi:arabinofuranan 3-O-arabinosyltransferase
MAQSPLSVPLFPFWHWLTFGRLLLAGCWIVFVSLEFGRFMKSATEFDTTARPPVKMLRNPFADSPPKFDTPEMLAERKKLWMKYEGVSDGMAKEERERVSDFTVPGNIPERGNHGYMEVDFGAQWMLGRMMVRGYGQELYNRNRQRQVLYESFALEWEQLDHQVYRFPQDHKPVRVATENLKSDAEMLMDWTVGMDNDSKRWPEFGKVLAVGLAGGADTNPFAAAAMVRLAGEHVDETMVQDLTKPSCGGPLYPPVHALLYAPLAAIDDPRMAYYVFQIVSSLTVFLSAYCVRVISNYRIWTPVAGGFLVLYPGYQPGLTLGQNHIVSLAIVMAGWALACRDRQFLGGFVWGFLAFKPVWAVVFGLAPLMMGKPRFLLGMATSGLGLCAATLPLVGVHGWKNWLANGGEATMVYNRNSNWIHLSRDLSGIVRRLMLDISDKSHELTRNVPTISLFGGEPKYSAADLVSWAVLFAVFAATMIVYWVWGRPRKLTGLSAGFLFLGCYLCCFRFMYYDALLSALPVAVLFAYPLWYLRGREWTAKDGEPAGRRFAFRFNSFPLTILALLMLSQTWFLQMQPFATVKWVPFNREVTLLAAMDYNYATDTLLLIALWMWAGWQMVRSGSRPETDECY